MKKSRKVAGPLKDLYRQSACQANQLAAAIYTAADSQMGSTMLQALESGNLSSIVSASIDPHGYSNADTFSRDYLCVELMSKFPHWDIGIDRTAVALRKFSEVEQYLASLSFSENLTVVANQKFATMRAVEMTARRQISKILGEFRWDEVHRSFAFGPGASTSQPKRRGDASYKFGAQRPQLSYNAEILAHALSCAHPTWRFTAEVVDGSRLVTVPKNAKTDRSICIEPDLNMYFQKGLGKVIRRHLNRWGLLMPDAQQYNAELARQGSASGRLATVDLSNASDSIHLGLVQLLLPAAWVTAIEQMRSTHTVLPSGERHLLRKVSSMGNGFTFELETLIFYALCQAVITHFASSDTERQCTVFGDDIIISSDLVPVLREVLHYFGFEMNTKKTFWTGNFRESCGKHFFGGTDVSPFYIRDHIDSVPRKYWAANTIRRYSRLPSWGLDSRWLPPYQMVIDSIPKYFQEFKIPDGYGDGGLIADWDDVRPSRQPHGLDAWAYRAILPKFGKVKLEGQGVLLKSLHDLEFPVNLETHQLSTSVSYIKWADNLDHLCVIESFDRYYTWRNRLRGSSPGQRECVFPTQVIEHQASLLPKPQGWKVHKGGAQRWPSHGTWV